MSGQGGAIAVYLIKWFVVPVALAAIGFFFVGPRIGRSGADVPAPSVTISEGQSEGSSLDSKHAPDVDVSSRVVNPLRAKNRRRRSDAQNEPPKAQPAAATEAAPQPPKEPGVGVGGQETH
jgi:hypothetical protein